jgi:hypothetical protein
MSDDISVADVGVIIATLEHEIMKLTNDALPDKRDELHELIFSNNFKKIDAFEIGEVLYRFFPEGHPIDRLNQMRNTDYSKLLYIPVDDFFRFVAYLFAYRCAIGDRSAYSLWEMYEFPESPYQNRYMTALRDTGCVSILSLMIEKPSKVQIQRLQRRCAALPPDQSLVKPVVVECADCTAKAYKVAHLQQTIEDLRKKNAVLTDQNAKLLGGIRDLASSC